MEDVAAAPPPLSRRLLLGAAGAAPLLLARRRAFAAAEDKVRIGFISPRTGALASFGQTDGYVLDLARKALAQGPLGRRQDLRGGAARPRHAVRSLARQPARESR